MDKNWDWRYHNPPGLALDANGKPPVDHGLPMRAPVPAPAVPPANWRDAVVPLKMLDRPRDKRGFRMPYHLTPQGFQDGQEADLRKISGTNLMYCLRNRCCGLCGKRLFRTFVLSGGALCVMNRIFTEPPFHPDCFNYARQVCPFLTQPKFTHHERPGEVIRHADTEGVGKEGMERHCAYTTDDYLLVNRPGYMPLIVAKQAKYVDWYDLHGIFLCRTRPQEYGQ